MGKLIYLDNAATTKTSPTVVEAMLPYFTEYYGNASSIYSIGTKSKEAINKSRETIAATLGAKPEEIYFTAGGSESYLHRGSDAESRVRSRAAGRSPSIHETDQGIQMYKLIRWNHRCPSYRA